MKIHLLRFLLLAAIVIPAQARKPKVLNPAMVPISDATLTALSSVIAASKVRQDQLGVRAGALQVQIAQLKAKAKNPKVEIGEQLSKDDQDAYNLLNTQLKYLQGAMTVESFRQRNLAIARDIYRASFFTATMMTEYIGDKGDLDDDFDDFCRAKAASYGLSLPVGMLLSAQDYIMDAAPPKK